MTPKGKGTNWMMKEVLILSFTIMVKGVAKLMTHSKCMNVIVKPIADYSDFIVTARSYVLLRPG